MMSRWAARAALFLCLALRAAATELPGAWHALYGNVHLFQSFGGVLLAVDLGEPSLWVFDQEPPRRIALKPEQTNDFFYAAMDGEGGFWIFSDPLRGERTWFHPNAEKGWLSFGRDPAMSRRQPLFDRESAFLFARSHYGRPFALGAGGELYQLAHGPGQRMAFLNDRGRVGLFDGRMWETPISGHELPEKQAPRSQPYFGADGHLRLEGEKGRYVMTMPEGIRLWTLEEGSETRKTRPEAFRRPEALPYAQWVGRMGPVAWSQSGFELQFSVPGHHRMMILEQDHPLNAFRDEVRVAMDTQGVWAFAGRSGKNDARRVLVYRPDPPFRWKSPLGRVLTIHAESTSLLAQFGFAEDQAAHASVRMRREGAGWTEIEGTPVLDAGNYAVEFEIACTKPPFFAGPLPSSLSYGLDLEGKMREWIAALGAERYEDRQAAEARLRDALMIAKPLLREAVEQSKDPEIAFRALRLLNPAEGAPR